jgi:DNA-binding transcriptional MerR regulator
MLQPKVNLRSIDKFMDIGQVSKISKLPVSTLRFYEEKGLIQSIGRKGLRRYFSKNVVDTLNLISLGRNVGLSLDEIGEMLLPQGPQIDRNLLLSKANELDIKIIEMTAMRDGLGHASACKAPSHMECPKFLRLLNVLGKR